MTASAGLTGDGVVLRVRRPGGRSPSFEQVSPPKLAVFELATFGGRLYAGTGDRESGYGVWRADPDRPRRWEPVVVGGAGRGAAITSVVSMAALSRAPVRRREWLAQLGVPRIGADPRGARRPLGGRRGQIPGATRAGRCARR